MSLPSISFLAGGVGGAIQDPAGSGLGFFGNSFGASVPVGGWQSRTFVTNGNGTTQGWEAWNNQYLNAASGIIGQAGSGIPLTAFPNQQATLNIRFLNNIACKTQNVQLWIYDRGPSYNNPASGVTTAIAEVVHPDPVQNNNGSGSTLWLFPGGS